MQKQWSSYPTVRLPRAGQGRVGHKEKGTYHRPSPAIVIQSPFVSHPSSLASSNITTFPLSHPTTASAEHFLKPPHLKSHRSHHPFAASLCCHPASSEVHRHSYPPPSSLIDRSTLLLPILSLSKASLAFCLSSPHDPQTTYLSHHPRPLVLDSQ